MSRSHSPGCLNGRIRAAQFSDCFGEFVGRAPDVSAVRTDDDPHSPVDLSGHCQTLFLGVKRKRHGVRLVQIRHSSRG